MKVYPLSWVISICSSRTFDGRFLTGVMLRRRAMYVAGLLALGVAGGTLLISTKSIAQEVEQKSSVGGWSIFCVKNVPKPSIQDCSLVTSVVAGTESNAWVRLGIAFVSSPVEIEMTIRTPRLSYFSKGVSIASGGYQLGRAFIEKCSESFCQTTVAVDARTLRGLAVAKTATLEYQISEEESVALAVNVEQFIPALGELGEAVGLGNPSAVADSLRSDGQGERNAEFEVFRVEMRTNPYDAPTFQADDAWGRPLKDCFGAPATKLVRVSSDLKIQDDRNFEEWLSSSQRCADRSVFWITRDAQDAQHLGRPETPLGEASKYAVYEKVKDKVPNVVTTDASGRIPLRLPSQ